ncbi:hypothetical protein ACFWCB_15465 [Streptomyces sp. NPDC060048]|uniref:hypothetical protein n=1 Tax=unclassified Streptomyces TaxID=2593676 RepID=UPI0036C96125
MNAGTPETQGISPSRGIPGTQGTPGGHRGSALRPLGAHFVIAPAAADDDPLAAALAALRPAPDALLVLAAAADAAPVLRRSLARLAALARERGASTLVLAASGLAATAAGGHRPAEAFARAAGLPVIAPDGLVSVEPDGGLRVTAPEAAGSGSWWLIDPTAEPEDLGPSWPPSAEPEARATGEPGAVETGSGEAGAEAAGAEAARAEATESEATGTEATGTEAAGTEAAGTEETGTAETGTAGAGTAGAGTGELGPGCPDAEPIGQGFWLAAPGRPDRASGLAAADSGTLVLVVGSPQEPDLPAAELLRRVAALELEPPGLLLSAPWAPPAALAGMAAVLAAHFGQDVRAAVGLPVRGADHCTTTFLDAEGRPTWEPVIAELTASAALGRVVASGWHGLHPLPQAGPAVFGAWDGWVLEAVPAGLWLRPEAAPRDGEPRMRPAAYHRPQLIVGEPGRALDGEVWDHLDEVLAALPSLGGEPFGVVLAGRGDEDAEAVGRFLCRRHPVEWISAEPSTESPGPTSAGDPAPLPASPDPLPAPEFAPEPAGTPVPVREPVRGPDPELPVGPPSGPTAREVALGPTAAVAPLPVPVRELPGGPVPLREPARGPDPELPVGPPPVPAVPVAALGPAAAQVPVRESPVPAASPCVSGERDRDGMKLLLGKRYHLIASKAEMVALKLPGLRSSQGDDLKPDLVAVLLHQADSGDPATRAELVAAARAGSGGPLVPYLRCLGSGLRRLPSHHGAVLVGASAQRTELDAYRPGSLVAEPAPVSGVPAQDVELGASVEFGIWSTTGRRTAAFASTAAEPEVVFAPGTRYSVLAVRPGGDGTGLPARVLLREVSFAEAEATPAGDAAALRDQQACDRLTAWFESRDRIPPEGRRAVEAERFRLGDGVAPP